jgi:MarR family
MAMGEWRFLSNHAQALLCIADDPDVRLRDIAVSVGITERAAHRIVGELVTGGYVSRKRDGRRNHYEVNSDLPLPAPVVRDRKLSDLLELFAASDGQGARK